MTSTNDGLRQASVRAVTGTTLDYDGDWHALFTAAGIAAGTYDERMLAWINSNLSTSYTSLPQAMQALAVANGAYNFSSMGTFNAGGSSLPTPTGLIQVGDSRIALGSNMVGSGTTVDESTAWGHAATGTIMSAIDNAVRTCVGHNFGVSQATSRALEVALGRLVSSSIAATGNPANADTGVAADAKFNTSALGDYTPLTHPSNIVVFLSLINDFGVTYFGSGNAANTLGIMTSAAACFDALGAANKVVFAGETPQGKSTFWAEAHTIAANSVTATNTTGFVDGSAFPTPVAAVVTAANAVLTKVASAPGVGQYSVSAGGVYTFNAGLSGVVYITYASGSSAQTSAFMTDVTEWLQSTSASPFVAPTSGNSYAIKGARNGRNFLYYVDFWGALKDPATGDMANGMSPDGKHAGHACATAMGAAFRTAFLAAYPAQTTSLRPVPTVGNQTIASGGGGTGFTSGGTGGGVAFGATIFNTSSPPAASSLRMTFGATAQAGPTIITVTDLGTGFYRLSGAAVDTTNNGPNGAPTANFINVSTGAWDLRLLSANTASIYLERDWVNLIPNALFNTDRNLPGTKSAAITVTGSVPANINVSCPDGNLGGTLSVALSTGTHPTSGKNALIVDINGVGDGSGITINITDNAFVNRLVAGSQISHSAMIEVQAGTNGHLYGLYDASIQFSLATAGGATRGAYTSIAHYNFSTLQGISPYPMTDADVTSAQLRRCLSGVMDLSSPMTISAATAKILIGYMPKPVSARIYITEHFLGVV
jgi:hypothetical protein